MIDLIPQSVVDAFEAWEQLHFIEVAGVPYVEVNALVEEFLALVVEQATYVIGYINAMCFGIALIVVLLVKAFCMLYDFLDDRRKRKAAATLPSSPDLD